MFLPNSLLVQLRCQVHMELAKCQEDCQQFNEAICNVKKVWKFKMTNQILLMSIL